MSNTNFSFLFSFRRKPARNGGHNKPPPPTAETSIAYEDEHRHSPKTHLLPTKPPTSVQKQSNRSNGLTNDDIPPVLPPRKPLDKKNSAPMQSAILNPFVLNNSSLQTSSNAVDDTSSLAPARVLTSKEVRIRNRKRRRINSIQW